jgi:hypothetical protein
MFFKSKRLQNFLPLFGMRGAGLFELADGSVGGFWREFPRDGFFSYVAEFLYC